MKVFRILLTVLTILAIAPWAYPQVKNVSNNEKDTVKITKITPRTLSHLLKPINYQVTAEVDYNLATQTEGKIVFQVIMVNSKGEASELTSSRKIYPITGGSGVKQVSSGPVQFKTEDDVTMLFMVASLTGPRGRELAFSSSKNFVAGTFKIFPDNRKATRDFIRRIDIQPRPNSDIITGKSSDFHIILDYGIQSEEIGYVDVLFQKMSDVGTAQALKMVTLAVPRGQGKISLKPVLFFEDNLAGNNIGITIFLWTEPLKAAADVIRINEYFLKKR